MNHLRPGFCWEQTVEVGSSAAGCDSPALTMTVMELSGAGGHGWAGPLRAAQSGHRACQPYAHFPGPPK